MMVISLIKRPQGHVVRLDGAEYVFRSPDWTCDCTEPRALARFQAIPEGYRLEKDVPETTMRDDYQAKEQPVLSEPIANSSSPAPRLRRRRAISRSMADET
jgi:hypothetical protein